ncbi:ribonuclease [Deinococcus cavernae]|uniref:Ribonuclease n=1 Tax=Deinococcus cavernae TaxID=2320857 RepID=A0A418V666_9DEIO|nr:ribonuclease domain-containing protein [Deinococcus cavernae]RJF71588.1 ribonuclease [Deinococcus cavernae]
MKLKFAFLPLAAVLASLLVACDLPTGKTATPNTGTSTTSPPAQVQKQSAREPANDPISGLKWISLRELPREGQQMHVLIGKGGPFRYSKDGATFGNREGLLPSHARGYYREYTVKTPGEDDRGARRIICGGQPVTSTAECYYTADHYSTFRRIRP